MDNIELQKLTEDISKTYFKKPFRHQALFNDRLKTTGGRYLLTLNTAGGTDRHHQARALPLSPPP